MELSRSRHFGSRRRLTSSRIAGTVDRRAVAVGAAGWLEGLGFIGARVAASASDGRDEAGRAKVFVAIDGRLAAVIVMGDQLREDAAGLTTGAGAERIGA